VSSTTKRARGAFLRCAGTADAVRVARTVSTVGGSRFANSGAQLSRRAAARRASAGQARFTAIERDQGIARLILGSGRPTASRARFAEERRLAGVRERRPAGLTFQALGQAGEGGRIVHITRPAHQRGCAAQIEVQFIGTAAIAVELSRTAASALLVAPQVVGARARVADLTEGLAGALDALGRFEARHREVFAVGGKGKGGLACSVAISAGWAIGGQIARLAQGHAVGALAAQADAPRTLAVHFACFADCTPL
jgi:hypothetical protein